MKKYYDIIIIGAGPSGLTLATCCIDLNLKILIIDKNNEIGGCHRVTRIKFDNEFLFTEHGPRVYSSSFLNFKKILNQINFNFSDFFVPYNFQLSEIGNKTLLSVLTKYELFVFFKHFFYFLFNNNYGKNITMDSFLKNNNFSVNSIDIIDRICRLTDGAGIDKYTLNEFFELPNQHFFYKMYQPKYPNDIGLFKYWKKYLKSNNVEFMLNTNVDEIIMDNNLITSCIVNNNIIYGNKFVLAIPPFSIYKIIKNSNNKLLNIFNNLTKNNNFEQYTFQSKYIDYISICFHWNIKLFLPKVHGLSYTDWGIVFVVLSDYMQFSEYNSKTVISVAITITDKKSSNIYKTANECSEYELIQETFKQLQFSFPNLIIPTYSLLSPTNKFINNKWISDDSAFITVANFGFLPFKNNIISNLYNLGTHNGKHKYKFTTLESAVSNAMILSCDLFPILKSKYIPLSSIYSFRFFLFVIIICIFIILCFKSGCDMKK